MKGKLKLFFAVLLLAAFLFDSCGKGHNSAYQTPKKGKHGGRHRIKTEMGGYL